MCGTALLFTVTEDQVRKFKDVFEILDDDHSGEMDAKGEKEIYISTCVY